MVAAMKPLPPPYVPGATEAERMDYAVRKAFSVSKQALLRHEAKEAQIRERKKRMKKR
jgi:hypothetical protein